MRGNDSTIPVVEVINMSLKFSFAKLGLGAAIALAGVAGLPGAGPLAPPVAQAQAYPPGYVPVPPPRFEAVPALPGPAYVWAPGHWVWTGHGYAWTRGHYVIRHAGWHHWVDGHWTPRGAVWVWVPGYWD
jgi:hypothetical protein